MKVLMINTVCGIRSTGRICTDLADILSEQGHQVKIAYGRESVPEKYQKYAVRIGSNLDCNIHALNSRFFDNSGFGSTKATYEFLKWVKKYNPDIIHLHNLHGYYINLELLFDYLSKANKPVIWTLHDCWAFTGHCAYFSRSNCQKWKQGCYNCPQKKGYPASFFLDNSKKNWEKKKRLFTNIKDMMIVTPSKWLASLVEQSYLKKYKVTVINNGIDLSVFKPTKSDFRKKYDIENKIIILGVATSWSESKGLKVFLELSDVLDSKYKIVLVGLTKDQIKSIPPKILGIPRTNNTKELAEIYSTADVFLNPSYQETMGLTTVEAYACGTPVITSNLTAIPEMVNDNCGIVLNNNSDIQEIINDIDAVTNRKWNGIECEAYRFEKYKQFEIYLNHCYYKQ